MKKASLVLAASLSLLAAGCGGGAEESGAEGTGASPSPGTEGPLDGTTPSPGPPAPAPPGSGASEPSPDADAGEPPEPGETTTVEFEAVARGTDPVDGRFTPRVLLARTAEEGAAAADASPAPGAAAVLREWDDYDARSMVVVLGGSQPDAAHRLVLRSVNIIKNGGRLLASGRIIRPKGAAAQVISIPWVALAVEAEAADTVERCTLSLESATTPFDTSCG